MAARVADAVPRGRVAVTGTLTGAGHGRWRTMPAWTAVLDDGSGCLLLVFTGVRAVPGVVAGARLAVEGTVLAEGTERALWNPRYHFEA